jgi:predicted SnoaL-like aldol condensation-catalyzing enzyme
LPDCWPPLLAAKASAQGNASGPGIALLERLVAVVNAHDVSKFDEIYAAGANYVNHQTLVAAPSGVPAREAFKSYITQRIAAFPDLTLRIEVPVENGDLVAANLIWSGTQRGPYLGVPATDILRVKDGRFSDHWGAVDLYGLLGQRRA